MSQHENQPPKGWTKVPEDQLHANAFAVTKFHTWEHLNLVWNEDRYVLHVYNDKPSVGDVLLEIELATLIVAEAEWSYEERLDGKVMPHWIAESNAEIESKAAALEALAARLRARHKRPEVVRGGTDAGAPHG